MMTFPRTTVTNEFRSFWRASTVLRNPVVSDVEHRSAVLTMRYVALRGSTVRLRVRAIQMLRQQGLGVPAVIGGGF